MMIDIGAYGALDSLAMTPTVAPGLATDTFRTVSNKANVNMAKAAQRAFRASAHLRNRFPKLNPQAIRNAQKSWVGVADDIRSMGGASSVDQGAAQGYVQESAMMAEAEAIPSEMKPYLYAGLAVAGTAALYLMFRK